MPHTEKEEMEGVLGSEWEGGGRHMQASNMCWQFIRLNTHLDTKGWLPPAATTTRTTRKQAKETEKEQEQEAVQVIWQNQQNAINHKFSKLKANTLKLCLGNGSIALTIPQSRPIVFVPVDFA